MIGEKKKYLIQLFLKRCTLQEINRKHIDFSFELFKNTYNVSDEVLSKLRKKYNIDEYIDRLLPLIDEQFTTEELQAIVKFYSSDMGKKILDPIFLEKVGKIGTNMFAQIEQEFSINNNLK
ncbi:MAG: DUF2059 domain-containing protein [Candidatus Asgardarchaeia archaeon]